MTLALMLCLTMFFSLTVCTGLAEGEDEEQVEEIAEEEEEAEEGTEGDILDEIAPTIVEAYMGALEDGTTIFYASSEEFVIVALLDPTQTKSMSFVGPYQANDDSTLTITDQRNGQELTIAVQEAEGGYLIELVGYDISGAIAPTEVEKVFDAFRAIDAETQSVN
jgi:hypothetical protein